MIPMNHARGLRTQCALHVFPGPSHPHAPMCIEFACDCSRGELLTSTVGDSTKEADTSRHGPPTPIYEWTHRSFRFTIVRRSATEELADDAGDSTPVMASVEVDVLEEEDCHCSNDIPSTSAGPPNGSDPMEGDENGPRYGRIGKVPKLNIPPPTVLLCILNRQKTLILKYEEDMAAIVAKQGDLKKAIASKFDEFSDQPVLPVTRPLLLLEDGYTPYV
uniref:Reverse transcriptase domain-containing protein n=1 Tax=Steinernema glaseri TaxID=37863 RepID=A0A1I7ZWQ7_9BILA